MKDVRKIEAALKNLFGVKYKYQKDGITFSPILTGAENCIHQDCQVWSKRDYKKEGLEKWVNPDFIDELNLDNGKTYFSIYQG